MTPEPSESQVTEPCCGSVDSMTTSVSPFASLSFASTSCVTTEPATTVSASSVATGGTFAPVTLMWIKARATAPRPSVTSYSS